MSGYLGTLLLFYRRNVRVQPVRELMAIAGIAAGVALLFTVQVAHHTITGSFQQIASGVAGNANLEVASRNSSGFSESISEEIERTPGVRVVAPLLQEPIVAVGRSGRRALMLVGATGAILHLHGRLSQQFLLTGLSSLRKGFLLLTGATANSIGVHPGMSVTILNRGREWHLALAAIVPGAKLGAAGESPVAAAPLPIVQALAQASGAVSRVLIQTSPGQQSAVSARLRARLGPTLNVRPTTTEARLLENAAGPEREITLLFSAISIVAGIILAYAALLMAGDDRRRFVVYLIEIGTPESMIIASLAFDALVLGVIGTLAGLIAGDAISLVAFRSVPGYIAAAFPVGGQRVVGIQIVLISIAGGMFAAFTAAALPAIAILRSGAAAEPEAIGRSLAFAGRARISSTVSFAGGLILAVTAVLVSELSPGATVVAIVALAVGLILCLPLSARGLVALARCMARHSSDPSARLSVAELRRSPTRSVALLATGTIAVFLTVTISGSVADVQRAVRSGAAGLLASADLWVKPGGPENVYTTQLLAARGAEERLGRVPAVHSVLAWKDTFFDLPRRRVWVLGVPPQLGSQIVPSQLESGSLRTADRRLREGGWIALSRTVASEYHVGVGATITLPTPAGPKSFRVAALTANYGWLPGAIVMNREDLARDWQEHTPTQLAVTLEPGVPLADGKAAVERALPAGTVVAVKTARERRQEVSAVLGSTLSRLNDTTLVVLIGTIVSVIALITAAISQRRGRLDSLLSIGMGFAQFTRLIFYESGSMLLGGCLIGFGAGVLGQSLIDKWLQHTTGAPVRFAPAWEIGLRTVLIAAGIALVTSTVAVIKTTRPQLRPALQS